MEQIENYRKSLQFTLAHEVPAGSKNGGYTKDPKDLGGETKYGISKRYHPNVDIANLTPEQAEEIYRNEYWDPSNCDSLVFPLCTVVFDTSVWAGVSRSIGWLRLAENTNQFINMRRMYCYKRVNEKPDQVRFLSGWLTRCGDLVKFVDINSSDGLPLDLPKWGGLG